MTPSRKYRGPTPPLSFVASAVTLALLVGCGTKSETPESADKGAKTEAVAPHNDGVLMLGKEELARSGLRVEELQATTLNRPMQNTGK